MKTQCSLPIKQFFTVASGLLLLVLSTNSWATAAFARSTGANCNKCHTLSFPKLTHMGEKFMRNGFQMPKEENGDGFGLSDDVPEAGKKSDLKNVSEYLSVTGSVRLLNFEPGHVTPEMGNPINVGVLATGTINENTPVWIGIDVENGEAGIHSYVIGQTNVAESSLLNFRAGTLDPTTWTSFYGHGAALDSANPDIGAYGGHHGDESGFSRVGPGYVLRNALEYYGYTENFIWALAASNGDVPETTTTTHSHASGNHDAPDFWASARMDIDKNVSMSILWYKAAGSFTEQALTLATNIRSRALDLRGQYSTKIGQHEETGGGGAHKEPSGYTIQTDYALTRELLGTLRFDATNNGEVGGIEQQLTFALVFKPKPNIKLTASYIAELTASTVGHSHNTGTTELLDPYGDRGTINVRFMF